MLPISFGMSSLLHGVYKLVGVETFVLLRRLIQVCTKSSSHTMRSVARHETRVGHVEGLAHFL